MNIKNTVKASMLLTGLVAFSAHAGSEANPVTVNASCNVNNYSGNPSGYIASVKPSITVTKNNGHSVFVSSHPTGCKYNTYSQIGFITPSAPTGFFDTPDWHTHYRITVNADYSNNQKTYAKGSCSFDVAMSTGTDKNSIMQISNIQSTSSMKPVTCDVQPKGQAINVSFTTTE